MPNDPHPTYNLFGVLCPTLLPHMTKQSNGPKGRPPEGGGVAGGGRREGGREGGEWISQQLHGLSPVIIWPICYDDSTGKHQTFSGLLNLSATNAALCSNQYAGGVAVNNSELTAAAGSWNIHRSPFTVHRSPFTGGQTDLWPIR